MDVWNKYNSPRLVARMLVFFLDSSKLLSMYEVLISHRYTEPAWLHACKYQSMYQHALLVACSGQTNSSAISTAEAQTCVACRYR